MKARYLWDRSGPPDPFIVQLERTVAARRLAPRPAAPARRRRSLLIGGAAAAAAAAAVALILFASQPPPEGPEGPAVQVEDLGRRNPGASARPEVLRGGPEGADGVAAADPAPPADTGVPPDGKGTEAGTLQDDAALPASSAVVPCGK